MKGLGTASHEVDAEDLAREFRNVGFAEVSVWSEREYIFEIRLTQPDARRLLWLLEEEWIRQMVEVEP